MIFMENIVISNTEAFDKKVEKFVKAGAGKVHVIADFDRTLTKAFVNGQKSPTVIAQIRNGTYLTSNYAPEAHKLYDVYHPLEIDPNLSPEVKNKKMQEWWERHFELLFRCGLTKKVMEEIVAARTLKFRDGALEFMDLLREKEIPLVIMSAGPGDMIGEYLRLEGRLYDNAHIVANMLEFDRFGKAVGLKGKIIHSLNKDEAELKGLSFYKQLQKRKNVLLLGDGVDDLKMIHGFNYAQLMSFGFLNEEAEKSIDEFRRNFDVVLLNDTDMSYVNGILRRVR